MNTQLVNTQLGVSDLPVGGLHSAARATLRPWPATVAELLLGENLLSPEALARATLVQSENGERLEAVLTRLGLVSESALASALSRATGLPLVDASAAPAVDAAPGMLATAFLRDSKALPLAMQAGFATVAVANPLDGFVLQALAFALERPVHPVVMRPGDIDTAIDRLYGVDDQADAIEDGFADEADLERLKDMASDAPVIRAVNRLIGMAAEARASDIHVEPADDRLIVRFRIDGLLVDQDALPAAMRLAFVSRVKIMAGLNIAEKRLPQDGRMRVAVRGHEIDLRVATAPSIHGESVVLRILDRSNLALDFASLGFDAALIAALQPVLARPHGIFLVTGPTGSGKTTTLYAALSELNTAFRKVLTIEDPIEYRLDGIIQTQVAPAIGLNFATALRSFLRQDPDVMMVGEIRDIETAQVAVQAALTGHTILSTLHTNSAASAVTRLIDMGVEPFLISSTLNAVLAQRLVRRLCPHCRSTYQPAAAVLSAFGGLVTADTAGPFYHATGCAQCDGTGYRGRVAVLELLVMNDAIADLALARAHAHEIAEMAARYGMRGLLEDGLAKARAGVTTLDEILRVASDG